MSKFKIFGLHYFQFFIIFTFLS